MKMALGHEIFLPDLAGLQYSQGGACVAGAFRFINFVYHGFRVWIFDKIASHVLAFSDNVPAAPGHEFGVVLRVYPKGLFRDALHKCMKTRMHNKLMHGKNYYRQHITAA
jgi:hypothetical protein